jgi:hypothetical protein
VVAQVGPHVDHGHAGAQLPAHERGLGRLEFAAEIQVSADTLVAQIDVQIVVAAVGADDRPAERQVGTRDGRLPAKLAQPP